MKTLDEKSIIGITALLINAAKIDEHYSDKEKNIMKATKKDKHDNDANDHGVWESEV